MGTPEYTLTEAIRLFSDMGLDGIEIIVQSDGYICGIPMDAAYNEIEAVKNLVDQAGLQVSGLTPYLNLFNSLDENVRRNECDQLKRVIDMAHLMDAGNIRIYGGKFLKGESDPSGRMRAALIQSMRECGDYSLKRNIKLNIENHFGTMTSTAHETATIVGLIDHPSVGILYDQANIAFLPAEDYEEAINLQQGYINYVHCKDLVYRENTAIKPTFSNVSHIQESERTVHSRIPGEGILDWPGIIKKLETIDYTGWLSLEYERRWQTIDLPEASEGMPRAAAYIRGILDDLKKTM